MPGQPASRRGPHAMSRRQLLQYGGGLSAAALHTSLPAFMPRALAVLLAGGELAVAGAANAGAPFSEEALLEQARKLAQSPYSPPEQQRPPDYKALDYDHYRDIHFNNAHALWKADRANFTVELFPAGYIYEQPVELHVVEGGEAIKLAYAPVMFSSGAAPSQPHEGLPPGFSGFRLHTPVHRTDQLDEFVVFQGASYFRSKAAGQNYGLSARGLAINTARPPADEFPVFRSFWLVKPQPGAASITIFALLDSASVSGLYKFVTANAGDTVMDVDCTLFPRRPVPFPGVAPLTSMFYFAPSGPLHPDDARPRVHDSDGLLMLNGAGEHVWRPLVNPRRIQYSSFTDRNIRGFGLMQRERRPDRFEDDGVKYETRPSLWVEPREDWGEGWVELVELPAQNEYFDNIVAYWCPKQPLEPGRAHTYRYRLTWCNEPRIPQNVAAVAQTLTGASTRHPEMRFFNVDFAGAGAFAFPDFELKGATRGSEHVQLSASAGTIVNAAFRRNGAAGTHRLGFEYKPQDGVREADLRCALVSRGTVVSEVWTYRWSE